MLGFYIFNRSNIMHLQYKRSTHGENMILGVLPTTKPGGQEAINRNKIHATGQNLRFSGFKLPKPPNMRIGGWSLEDFTSRLMVWLIYIPQGIMAILNKQVPFETWGRNMSVWLSTTGITSLGKSPKYGFNTFFNWFLMLPQIKRPHNGLEKLLNRFRMPNNYLELLHEAEIDLKQMGFKGDFTKASFNDAVKKQSFWSALSVTEKMKLEKLKNKLISQKNFAKIKVIDQVQKRMAVSKISAIMLSAVIMALAVGIVVQKAIFKFVSPLDKRFVPKTDLKTSDLTSQQYSALPINQGISLQQNKILREYPKQRGYAR